jgi:antitoxin ParD1/3/4
MTDRINARLPQALATHVSQVVGQNGFFETPSEYIRDLIRRDMARSDVHEVESAIREGYRDIAAGRYFQSTGSFAEDRKLYQQKEREGWN